MLLSSMDTQFAGSSVFWDVSCTSGCEETDPVVKYDYRVSKIDYGNTAEIAVLYHETCEVTKAPENPDAPQSETCTVNQP